MSRGAPPTQPLSAVPNQVTQQMASAGQMNLQQQQVNNQAMAQRNREQIAREQMESQEFMTGEALKQRQAQSLLQSANYQRLNENNMKIQEMRMADNAASRKQAAEQFNQAQQFKQQQADREMNMSLDMMNLKAELAMLDATDSVDGRNRLRDIEANILDIMARKRTAEKIQAGQEGDLGREQSNLLMAMDNFQKGLQPSIDAGVMSIAEDIQVVGTPTGLDDLTSRGFSPGAARGIGAIGEAATEFFTLGQAPMGNAYLMRTFDSLSDPEIARKVSQDYYSNLVRTAVVSSFPDANIDAVVKGYQTLLADEATPLETAIPQFTRLLQDNGVNPMVLGEILGRANTALRGRRTELAQEFGVTSKSDLGSFDPDAKDGTLSAAIQQKVQGTILDRFSAIAGRLPGMMNTDGFRAIIQGGSLPEVEAMLREEGFGRTGLDAGSLIEALEALEASADELSGLDVTQGLEEDLLERTSRDIRIDERQSDAAARLAAVRSLIGGARQREGL